MFTETYPCMYCINCETLNKHKRAEERGSATTIGKAKCSCGKNRKQVIVQVRRVKFSSAIEILTPAKERRRLWHQQELQRHIKELELEKRQRALDKFNAAAAEAKARKRQMKEIKEKLARERQERIDQLVAEELEVLPCPPGADPVIWEQTIRELAMLAMEN